MTSYDFYMRIAEILVPENPEVLFDYILNAMDDNGGFLRTRFRYFENPLPNKEGPYDKQYALVVLRQNFDLNDVSKYYRKTDNRETALNMEIFAYSFSDDEYDLAKSYVTFYRYPIKIDLVNGTYKELFTRK